MLLLQTYKSLLLIQRNIYNFIFIIIEGLPKTEYCIYITHPHLNEEMILSMFERTICTVLVFHAVNVK